jgi:hypothetical protein
LNCACWKDDENAWVKQETIETINEQLQELMFLARWTDALYGSKKKRLFQSTNQYDPTVTISGFVGGGKEKHNCDSKSMKEYQAR